ncbi:MAG: prepilin-type N-terminal cleavage/methylation domain-containing protein, partial [Wenzhouxiangella sp.]
MRWPFIFRACKSAPGSPGRTGRAGRQDGFTLIELMVVMMLVMLLFAVVGVSISRSVEGAELRAVEREITAGLRHT